MCQFCNLTRLSHRVAPLGTPSRSLSDCGQLSNSSTRNFRHRALREQLPRPSKSLAEVVLQPQFNPISDRLI